MMQAVILAAGLGNRLGALTRERPKALVPVAGRELILRVMDFLDHPSVGERIVVAGYRAPVLRAFLARHCPGVKVVENPHYEDGSIRSIEAALPHLAGDLLVMNVDHVYPRRMMARIAAATSPLAAVCDFDRALGADDMKVKLDDARQLQQISKQLAAFDAGYIGMTRVGASELAAYRTAVGEVRRLEGDAIAVERVLARLAETGRPAGICDASGIRWLEVDTPEDLAIAEQTLTSNPGFLS